MMMSVAKDWIEVIAIWLVIHWFFRERPRPKKLHRMSDVELDAYFEHIKVRDRIVVMLGAMIYAAAMTHAAYDRNLPALALGVGSLFATWVGYKWITRGDL